MGKKLNNHPNNRNSKTYSGWTKVKDWFLFWGNRFTFHVLSVLDWRGSFQHRTGNGSEGCVGCCCPLNNVAHRRQPVRGPGRETSPSAYMNGGGIVDHSSGAMPTVCRWHQLQGGDPGTRR